MASSRSMLRLLAVAMLAIVLPMVLGSCAQQRTDVSVGIGTAAYQTKPAKPYAVLYKPYAEMATLAYTDERFLSGPGARCPVSAKLLDPALVDGDHSAKDNLAAAGWLANLNREGWSCLFGHVGAFGCSSRSPECVEGLEYHVWRNGCREAVIAFRGSDNEIGDWLSNLRWFVARPLFDQYDQVQAAVPHIIKRIYGKDCRPRRIIATGHSLGGGLAQHVAYADKRVDYVYAFDPSPVTAFFGVPFPTRSAATQDLGIDRIYEAGEVLSLPRYLTSGLFPTSQCRPRVRIVRFATVTAPSLVERHRIGNLTRGLTELSVGAKNVKVPLGFKNARECDFVLPDKFGE